MISKLIDWCIHNRLMVLLLTAFLIAAGVWAMMTIKIDAIPDLSDVQVIIVTDYPGQAPQIVEDQVTYKLTKAMLNVPQAKVVRGYSMFGTSFVYIIFEDGTDMYWARSRVLERLSYAQKELPAGVSPQLGPEASGVGWVYEYVLTTGNYCPKHPNGAWHDPSAGKWYAGAADAPKDAQGRLIHRRAFGNRESCPLDGGKLSPANIDLARLRGLQDWYIKYELSGLENVAEVASIGGFEKQYQVVVDPVKLLAYRIPLGEVKTAIERSNANVGGRVMELSEREYAVQGLGYLGHLSDSEIAAARAAGKSIEDARTAKVLGDLRKIAVGASSEGSPIYLSDIAEIRTGPEMRRGVLDWNGAGEAVGGIVVMREGQNARTTIDVVKAKLADVQRGLPPGVEIEVSYDRSDLIDRAVGTLTRTLLEEITVVALVCIFFLLHARSELVAVFVVPTGVLCSLLIMRLLGINANVMSLGGIAIAIGVMVDSSIVMVENSHKHLDREEERLHANPSLAPRPRVEIIAEAAREVGPSLFFALLIIVVSFLPIFVLTEQAGRMFKPLAYTKTFAMAASSFLAVTIIPVLMSLLITSRMLPKAWGWKRNLLITLGAMLLPAAVILMLPLEALAPYRHWIALGWVILMGMLLVPQKIIHENVNPVSWLQQKIYHPLFVAAMKFKWLVLAIAVLALLSTIIPWKGLGSEFMPPLEEGDLLYMPTTNPGISMTKARELLQQTDRLIMQFPEVQSVMGKAGRAETATDPAPTSMFETTITLHRDKSRWRQVPDGLLGGTRPITLDELIYGYELPDVKDIQGNPLHVPGLNEVVQVPGLTNSWTMPIKTRIDMLSTGIKTPVGVKVMGPDLETLSQIAQQITQVIKTDPATSRYTISAFAEKTLGGSYLDIEINKGEIGRYGLHVADVQDEISTALGGMTVTQTVEGLERYSVNVRYGQELRDSVERLKAVLVSTPKGAQVPLGQLASFVIRRGPDMIRSENARPSSWVYVDMSGTDLVSYVENAQAAVARDVKLPAGYSLVWSGEYEYYTANRNNMIIAVAVAVVLIVLLLYVSTRSWLRVGIVMLAVPFSLIGALWFTYLLGYNLSTAVWVGLIALAGLDAETGIVMLLYLDNSFERFKREGRMRDRHDLWQAVHDGAVKRIRPKTMTVATAFIGLVPLLWAQGAGADTMARLAAPMIGGLVTSFVMELLVYPILFYIAKSVRLTSPSQGGCPAGSGGPALPG